MVGKQLKGALTTAMAAGWFKELANASVPLGGSVLPAGFPLHNISQSVQVGIQQVRETYDEDSSDDGSDGWQLEFAKQTAGEHGFEIKVSAGVSYVLILRPERFVVALTFSV